MAYENLAGTAAVTMDATTGLAQYRFVVAGASGAAYPTTGAPVAGVLVSSGTTASTAAGQYCAVQTMGIAKVEAAASTMAAGNAVVSDSSGRAATAGAGDYRIGTVIDGSSGAAGRVLSIQLESIGTT